MGYYGRVRSRHSKSSSSPRMSAAAIFVAIAAALLVSACCGAYPTFDPGAPPMTSAQLQTLVDTVDAGAAGSIDFKNGPAERQAALARLRSRGADGARAATMLTKGFPPSDAAVPFLVRIAKVDGTKSLIVVEAWGAAGGKLTNKQVWLFDWPSGGIRRVIRAGQR
jgi:hypothetical protein